MRLVVLGDVGTPGEFHAGGEGMALAAVAAVRRRVPVEVTALSADPTCTTARHGWDAVARIGFPHDGDDASRAARLDAVMRATGGAIDALAWDDPAWAVIHAVAGADAVLISGGGNLNSTWPEHVYERAALGRIANALDRPLVITGQTIGPHLTGAHGELIASLLHGAALVGLREESSHALCRQLGVVEHRLGLQVDDASFAEWGDVPADSPAAGAYVAMTFAGHSGLLGPEDYVRALARLVSHVRTVTGLDVLLVPHQGATDGGERTGDVAVHDAIRDAVGDPRVHSLPLRPGTEAAYVQHATVSVSTRYHPAVCALAAGVPALALATDRYTSTKLRGAMANMGVDAFALGSPSLLGDDAALAFDELWVRREELSSHIVTNAQARRAEAEAWWDGVVEAIKGNVVEVAPTRATSPVQIAVGPWSAGASRLLSWADELSGRLTGVSLAAQAALLEASALTDDVASSALAVATLRAELDAAADEMEALRESVRSSHELAEEYLEELVLTSREAPTVAHLKAELAASERELASIRGTRTFRYLSRPRRIWARARAIVRR